MNRAKIISVNYREYIKGIKQLKVEDQLRLLEIMAGHLGKVVSKKKHSIMELEGLGAEIWKGIDAQAYVNKERESWH
ncbi:hypothetical protein KKG61_05300 [bacterium]|nr:hypothetical protein [bacterium]MBU2462180.1 hypothetical protein [bacterium]